MAAGRDMNARLIVRLQDRFSAGLGALQRRLDGIGSAMRRISAVGAIAAGVALAGPIAQAAAFEDILRQSAITAGATGAAVEAMVARNRVAFERLARATGQSSEGIARANADLLAGGLPTALVDQFLPLVARAATATGASMEDMGRLVRLLNQQMAITPEQMPQALAALAQAGRDGNFELRDMAREMPNVLAIARTLGMQGPAAIAQLGAAFQLAMTGASSASEAANNVVNALQKLASPETVRSFREIGVNMEQLMASAARQGISPLEALVQKLREVTGGNMFRLSELFGDRQALMGLLPLINETARYIEVRDNAARARPELIDQGFEDRMRGAAMQMALLTENATQLWRRLSLVAAEGLAPVVGFLQQLHGWIETVDAQYPGLIDKVLRWGIAIGVAVTALATLVTVGGFVLGALAPIAAFMAGPFGIALGLIAAAAYLIYDNWDAIIGVFDRVRAAWDRFMNSEQMEETRRVFGAVMDWISERVGMLGNAFTGFAAMVRGAFASVTAWLQPLIDGIDWVLARLPSLPSFGGGAAAGPTPRETGARNGLRRQSIYGPEDAMPPGSAGEARVGGEIIVRAAPGTEIVDTTSRNPSVPITPNRGAMVAVP